MKGRLGQNEEKDNERGIRLRKRGGKRGGGVKAKKKKRMKERSR
jgi:hypothetical protein